MDGLSVPSHGAKLLSGTANKALAEEIARHMGIELCKEHVDAIRGRRDLCPDR